MRGPIDGTTAQGDWIDGRTGEHVPAGLEEDTANDPSPPTEHAVHSRSYIYAPAPTRGLEGLRQGVNLIIATSVDLTPMRLERLGSSIDDEPEHRYSYDELKTALSHPEVNRGSIAASAEPPTRGQQLAIYDAVVWWVAFVEREWRDLAPGEAMSGTATDTLEPILLDAWSERFAEVSQQLESWLDGEAKEIPERAASEAERCLRAAVYAYGSALDHSVRDQIEGIAKRESADHWWEIHEDPDAPNALQCSTRLLDRWFRWTEEPVLWRPIVALASSSEEVRITFRSNEPQRDPAQLIIDTNRAILDVGGECTALDHGGDSRRLFDVAEELRATMVDAVRRARSGNDA